MNVRKATSADANFLAGIVYDAGPEGIEYVFGTRKRTAKDFLRYALARKNGEFGYNCHYLVGENDVALGGGALFSADNTLSFLFYNGLRILRFYPFPVSLGVIARGLRIERILLPPKKNVQYIAHVSVLPAARGNGAGTFLVRALTGMKTKPVTELDVAATNPRAYALYERLGFVYKWKRVSRLARNGVQVPDYLRMGRKTDV